MGDSVDFDVVFAGPSSLIDSPEVAATGSVIVFLLFDFLLGFFFSPFEVDSPVAAAAASFPSSF